MTPAGWRARQGLQWRTNLTLRQLAPLSGVSKSAADRIVHHVGPLLALEQRRSFRTNTVLIADGTLVPARDHGIAAQSKNYRYSTSHQVVIDADTCLIAAIGLPVPRIDYRAWAESGGQGSRRHDDDNRRRRLPAHWPDHPPPPPHRRRALQVNLVTGQPLVGSHPAGKSGTRSLVAALGHITPTRRSRGARRRRRR